MTPETQPGPVLSRQERAREADQLILIFEETIAKIPGVKSATISLNYLNEDNPTENISKTIDAGFEK